MLIPVPLFKFICVKVAAAAELAPIIEPSIAPPFISTVVNVDVPEDVILPVTLPVTLPVIVLDAFIVVNVPDAAEFAPIIEPSIAPPSIFTFVIA